MASFSIGREYRIQIFLNVITKKNPKNAGGWGGSFPT